MGNTHEAGQNLNLAPYLGQQPYPSGLMRALRDAASQETKFGNKEYSGISTTLLTSEIGRYKPMQNIHSSSWQKLYSKLNMTSNSRTTECADILVFHKAHGKKWKTPKIPKPAMYKKSFSSGRPSRSSWI